MSTEEYEEHITELQSAQRNERAAYVVRGITEILKIRPDLRGVVPAAELLDERVRWSA